MARSEDGRKQAVRKLLLSRMRLLCSHGFFGLLLMHMRYALDESLPTAATDGQRIIFNPDFLDRLSDREVDFVMMHEILHVALRHCLRYGDREPERFNIACDIVVNSHILLENHQDLRSITLTDYGPSMHLAPDGKEGHEYTAEQVYEMLPPTKKEPKKAGSGSGKSGSGKSGSGKDKPGEGSGWDDHSRWQDGGDEDRTVQDLWDKRILDACRSVSIRDPSNQRGLLPLFAQRLLGELRPPQADWRTLLNDFVQEEIADYSFTPPDRRFPDSPFFLPDFNEPVERVEDILFMVDTSGSVSDELLTAAFSEIKGALDQFDGRLRGWLGFFDAAVTEPVAFEDVDSLRSIQPVGGGGTSFHAVFDYLRQAMAEKPPASLVILTDGYAPFPEESAALGVPVLWLLTSQEVEPPWGRVARITVSGG